MNEEQLGFDFRLYKNGEVSITRNGKPVTQLRGHQARKFLARINHADEKERQQIMARVTGNYKRGNERR